MNFLSLHPLLLHPLPLHPLLLHLSALLTAACIAGLWQGLLIACTAAVLCTAMRHSSAALRYGVLIASFAAVLGLPWLATLHSGTAADGQGSHGLRLAPLAGLLIATVWLIAAIVRILQLVVAARHVRAVRRSSTPLPDTPALVVGSRRVRLCSSPAVDAPVIIGFRSPQLLLPDWMLPGLSSTELHQIALHECEHLRRGDDWTNLLLECALALSPLNPALFWLNRTIRLQRELAVDAAVVAQTQKPFAYASCLTHFAEQRSHRRHLRLALSAWGRKPELVERVHALLDHASPWSRIQSASAFAGALAVLLAATTLLGRMPQLVRVAVAPDTSRSSDTLSAAIAPNTGFVPTAATLPSSPDAPAAPPFVRTAAISTSHGTGSILGARVVTATFTVAPTPSNKPRRGKLSRAHTPQTHTLTPAALAPPHTLRTSYVTSRQPSRLDLVTAADSNTDTPVEIVPALFYTRYAAVPTSGGWLLIEL